MSFEFSVPTRIVFGKGAFKTVGKEAKNYGISPLVITGRNSMQKYGHLDLLLNYLIESKLDPTVFSEISPNPKADEVNDATDIVRKNKCDFVIGLGGCSAIDAAKAVAVGVNYESIEIIIGKTIDIKYALPIIAIPTTAGSGAEVTKGAIITDSKKGIKLGIRGNALSPAVAIVDPELTYTLPSKITAETGFDALTHSIEPYVANMVNPITDVLAIEAMKIISQHLENAIKGDINAREKMSYAALLGGINVFNASSMGSVIEISHGAGLAAVYPSWLQKAYSYSGTRFDEISTIFINQGYSGITDFMEKIGVNYKLGDLGIKREQIPEFVEKVEGNLGNDPIKNIDRDLITKIYEESY